MKTTATIQMKKNAVSVVEVPGLIISALKAVCNATARISPPAANTIRIKWLFITDKASANPIDADAIT
jgi:hypothetical protein